MMRYATASLMVWALMTGWAACPDPGPAPPPNDADVFDPTDVAEVEVTVPEHPVTIFLNGIGNGVITSEPPGIDCGGTCSASFAEGTVVTLRPLPSVGHRFSGFSGEVCDGLEACTFAVTTAAEVGVVWEPMALTPLGGIALGDAGTDDRITALAPSSFGTVYATYSSANAGLMRLNDLNGDPEVMWQKNFGPVAADCPGLVLTSLGSAAALLAGHGTAGTELDPGGAAPVGADGTFIAAYSDGESYQWSHVADAGCPAAIAANAEVVAWTGEVTGTGKGVIADFGTTDSAVSMVVAVYGVDDGQPRWASAFATAEFDVARGRAVAVDPTGGVVVAGRVVNTGAVDFGGGPMPDGSSVVLARYDADGGHVWSTNYGGIDHDIVTLDLMSDGDLVMTGVERQGATEVAFVTRLDGQGAPRWLETLEYAEQQAPTGVLQLADGNLLVSGWRYTAGAPFAEATLTQLSGGGLLMWRQEVGSASGQERALALAQGNSGVWLAGWFSGDAGWDTGGAAPLSSAGGEDGFIVVVTEPAP